MTINLSALLSKGNSMGLLKKKQDESPAVQEPSLSEKIGDNSIEKGLPDLDNPQGKSNMGKVALFLGLLFATGLVAAGLIVFTGGDDDEVPTAKTEQLDMVTTTQNHDFNQDKSEIAQQEQLEMAVASETQAASQSEAAPIEVEPIAPTPTPPEPAPVTTVENPPEPLPTAHEPQQEAQKTPRNRKLSGSVLVDGKSDNAANAALGVTNSLNNGFQENSNPFMPTATPLASSADDDKPQENALSAQLKPTQTPSVKAKTNGNRDFMLSKGTNILCTLDTQIITTRAGFTRCVVTRDVYSANGRVLLLEKGTKIIGEQTAAMLHGQARVGILWNEATTPKGVTVSLNSPAAGQLGAAGVGARMRYHFWQRFGGAVLISLIGDLGDSFSNRQKSGKGQSQNISFENSSETAQDMATEALKNSINIPPTAYINHGTLINIMVARDVDFSGVYEVVKPYEMF